MNSSNYNIKLFKGLPQGRRVAIAQCLNAATWLMVLDTLPDR